MLQLCVPSAAATVRCRALGSAAPPLVHSLRDASTTRIRCGPASVRWLLTGRATAQATAQLAMRNARRALLELDAAAVGVDADVDTASQATAHTAAPASWPPPTHDSPVSYTVIPRCNLTVARVGVGSDDMGAPLNRRFDVMHRAVTKRGCNFVQVDGNDLLRRNAEAQQLRAGAGTRSTSDTRSEYLAPSRTVRSSAVTVDRRSSHGGGGPHAEAGAGFREGDDTARPRTLGPDQNAEATLLWERHALSRLVLQPASLAEGTKVEATPAAGALSREELVLSVVLRADHAGGALPPDGRVPLASVADAVRGITETLDVDTIDLLFLDVAGIDEASADASAKTTHAALSSLTNVAHIGLSSTVFDAVLNPGLMKFVRALSDANPRVVALQCPASLTNHAPLTAGLSSAASLAHDAGLSLICRKPLDLDEPGSGRAMRCVDTNSHSDMSPAEVAERLSDVLNMCIHLEVKFGDVAEAAAAEGGDLSHVSPDARWAATVGAKLGELDSLVQWRYVWQTAVWPSVNRVVRAAGSNSGAVEWAHAYKLSMMRLNNTVEASLEQTHAVTAVAVTRALDAALAHADAGVASAMQACTGLADRVVATVHGAGADAVLTEEPWVWTYGLLNVDVRAHQDLFAAALKHLKWPGVASD